MREKLGFPQEQLGRGDAVLYDSYLGNAGHRADYYAFFARIIQTRRTGSLIDALCTRRPVLVGSIEASLPRYLLICLVRSMLGKRTVGLLFRPLPLVNPTSLRLRLKRFLLVLLRRLTRVATITLLPFSVEPGFAKFATAWIYDPQLWDFADVLEDNVPPSSIGNALSDAAHGRRICCAIGRQDEDKGFDKFVELYRDRDDLRHSWLFASAGAVSTSLEHNVGRLNESGGFCHADFIDQDGLIDLYALADLVWCCYAPGYDQASGVFGRAVQFGLPVIVRKGSLLERFCQLEGYPHFPYDGIPEHFVLPELVQLGPNVAKVRQVEQDMTSRLRDLLGISTSA